MSDGTYYYKIRYVSPDGEPTITDDVDLEPESVTLTWETVPGAVWSAVYRTGHTPQPRNWLEKLWWRIKRYEPTPTQHLVYRSGDAK